MTKATTTDQQQLGNEILARIEAGDKAKKESDDHYLAAGLQLLQAQKRFGNVEAFIKNYCKGLGRSRAYELMAIAKGKTTPEEIRSKANARKKKHRATAAKAASTVRSGTDTAAASKKSEPIKSEQTSAPPQRALAEFKYAVDAWLAKMDGATRREAVTYAVNKATALDHSAAKLAVAA